MSSSVPYNPTDRKAIAGAEVSVVLGAVQLFLLPRTRPTAG